MDEESGFRKGHSTFQKVKSTKSGPRHFEMRGKKFQTAKSRLFQVNLFRFQVSMRAGPRVRVRSNGHANACVPSGVRPTGRSIRRRCPNGFHRKPTDAKRARASTSLKSEQTPPPSRPQVARTQTKGGRRATSRKRWEFRVQQLTAAQSIMYAPFSLHPDLKRLSAHSNLNPNLSSRTHVTHSFVCTNRLARANKSTHRLVPFVSTRAFWPPIG